MEHSFRENHGCIHPSGKNAHNQWVWSAMGVDKMVTWVLDALYPCWMDWLAAGTIFCCYSSVFFQFALLILLPKFSHLALLSSWFMIFSRSFWIFSNCIYVCVYMYPPIYYTCECMSMCTYMKIYASVYVHTSYKHYLHTHTINSISPHVNSTALIWNSNYSL